MPRQMRLRMPQGESMKPNSVICAAYISPELNARLRQAQQREGAMHLSETIRKALMLGLNQMDKSFTKV